VADRDALDAAIEARLAGGSTERWETLLAGAGVPCGPARSVPEALAHPMAARVRVGRWEQPAPPLPARALRPPPGLGEHTAEVLTEAGFGAEEVEALRAAGAFGRG
jgi:crotonobetainyl-CoA:carnitine CoA-transferase CaiB-like acyl-CoA transferase